MQHDNKTVLILRDPGVPQLMVDRCAHELEAAGYHPTLLPMVEAFDDREAVALAHFVVALLGSERATPMDMWMGYAVGLGTPVFGVADSPHLRMMIRSLERPALFLQPWPTLSVTESAEGGKGWAKLLAVMALRRTLENGTMPELAWSQLAEAFEGAQ